MVLAEEFPSHLDSNSGSETDQSGLSIVVPRISSSASISKTVTGEVVSADTSNSQPGAGEDHSADASNVGGGMCCFVIKNRCFQ